MAIDCSDSLNSQKPTNFSESACGTNELESEKGGIGHQISGIFPPGLFSMHIQILPLFNLKWICSGPQRNLVVLPVSLPFLKLSEAVGSM